MTGVCILQVALAMPGMKAHALPLSVIFFRSLSYVDTAMGVLGVRRGADDR